MRRGGRILVLLGLVLGLVTAGGTYLVVTSNQASSTRAPGKKVVVAMQQINERTEILTEQITLGEWSPEYIPVGAFENPAEVSGKLAVLPIYQGQIILPQMLVDKTKVKETRSNASFVVPEGKVAVAFPIGSLSGIAGAIQNGDTVDILLTLSPASGTKPITPTAAIGGEGQGLAVSQIMLQDILILNVGGWPVAGTGDKAAASTANMVTFALSYQDALALKAAREQGVMELVLRRAGEHGKVTAEPVNLQYLNKRFGFNLISTGK